MIIDAAADAAWLTNADKKAAIEAFEEWKNRASDFNKDGVFSAPADGKIIWDVDSDGNSCDYNNWFYMISDDNILYLNINPVPEYKILNSDLLGVDAESTDMVLGADTTLLKQEMKL